MVFQFLLESIAHNQEKVKAKKEIGKPLIKACRFLSREDEKDIGTGLLYELELSQFLVKSFAYAHGEIIHFVNCEI